MTDSPVKKITLSGVASYKREHPAHVTLLKINFVYGLNGTGKSTIANFLYDRLSGKKKEATDDNYDYTGCSIDYQHPQQQTKIFVYSQKFIKENFGINKTHKSIFLLDKKNKDAERAIKDSQDKIAIIEQEESQTEVDKQQSDDKFQNAKIYLQEEIWNYKTEYEKQNQLKKCMEGHMGSKKDFMQKVMDAQKIQLNKKADELLNTLNENLENLAKDGMEEMEPIVAHELLAIERNGLWEKKIVGAQDSYLADIIKQLGHEAWVREGIPYLESEKNVDSQCPFCKQGVDASLKQKITEHFDKTYEESKTQLKNMQGVYTSAMSLLQTKLDEYKGYGLSHDDLMKPFWTKAQKNIEKITLKRRKSGDSIKLSSTEEDIERINAWIRGKQEEHRNKKATQERLKKEFWQIIRSDTDRKIKSFQKIEKQYNEQYIKEDSGYNTKKRLLKQQREEQNSIIKQNQKKTRNVDDAINSINRLLKSCGMQGFHIEKVETDKKKDEEDTIPHYKIVRPTDKENVFSTLSEGEKMLISFFYFVNLCEEADNNPAGTVKKLIVIDDPVSSLSFDMVYEIATLINLFFCKKKKGASNQYQVIILTHHLYFLHEMFKQVEKGNKMPNDCKIYEVTKNEYTSINDMTKEKVVKNQYQIYWNVVKDIKNSIDNGEKVRIPDIMLPNAMRNILEHYFSFIEKNDSLKDALEKIGQGENNISYKSFNRYMNRGSHSDSINDLTHMGKIDSKNFIRYFEQVFKKTGNEKHYRKYMEG